MSHNQKFSLPSISSTLSLEFDDKLKKNIKGPCSTEHHVSVAQDQLRWLKDRNDNENCIAYGSQIINATPILEAMLQYSVMAGGVDGQRYTACAINTCHYAVHGHKLLVKLAESWLTYFLYPFKKASRIRSEYPSESPTPDSNGTASRVEPARDVLAARLLLRDGGRCVITGIQSYNWVPRGFKGQVRFTEGTQFIRRSLGVFKRPANDVTWTIIRNYSHVSAKMIDEMSRWIDEPENGMTLDVEVRRAFDELFWCLVPQSKENTYKVKHFTEFDIFDAQSETVTFSDHSGLLDGIPLPNPQFVALHAAVAHVLHESGAAKVIDEILDHFGDSDPAFPARNGLSARDLHARIAAITLLE